MGGNNRNQYKVFRTNGEKMYIYLIIYSLVVIKFLLELSYLTGNRYISSASRSHQKTPEKKRHECYLWPNWYSALHSPSGLVPASLTRGM